MIFKKNMYVLLVIPLIIFLVLMVKKENVENFDFHFFFILEFILFLLKRFYIYWPIPQTFPVLCWLRKKMYGKNIWLFLKYYIRANSKAQYTENSMVWKFALKIQFLIYFDMYWIRSVYNRFCFISREYATWLRYL